jgi:hypothetical protein
MASFSVREVAERIQHRGEDTTAVVDRLRNWTKEGLLKAIGEKNPGTGRKRRYSEAAVIDALILNTIAGMGIPAIKVGQLRGAHHTALQLARIAAKEVTDRDRVGQTIYLVVAR